ncbi:MAG: hypothetical protein WBX03_15145, partial [Terriglobales bacterium]
IAGLLYLLRFERVDSLGAYSIPSETGLLIPSVGVEKVYFRQNSGKSRDRKRLGKPRQSFLGHPNAILF